MTQTVAAFRGVLTAPDAPPESRWPADLAVFHDTNLDQVFEAVLAGRESYDLQEFFHTPLGDRSAITYRHDVFRDLDGRPLRAHVVAFGDRMRSMREYLALSTKRGYQYQQKRWFLVAAAEYCDAVSGLAEALDDCEIGSAGLAGLREFLRRYTHSTAFVGLSEQLQAVEGGLAGIRYAVEIKGDRVRVGYFHDEPDFGADVSATFERFRQGAVKSYLAKITEHRDMNHVEGQILDRVALLFPAEFGALDRFCAEHAGFADPVVAGFDREVQFYLAWLDYLAPLRNAGLPVSYSDLSDDRRERATATYDLALAAKLVAAGTPVVTNDYHLDETERVIVVSGPNQGGKTTFARTFGQLHYLARLGLPVAGSETAVALCDGIFTHFERPENLQDLIGKLHDDLVRVHRILDEATPRSVVILNEIFTSTTLSDARFLSRQILSRLVELDALCVCVTFLDELSRLGPSTVSMVSTVRPDDPATRTLKVVRQVADGRAYALAIARRYGLTYEQLQVRLGTLAAPEDGDPR